MTNVIAQLVAEATATVTKADGTERTENDHTPSTTEQE